MSVSSSEGKTCTNAVAANSSSRRIVCGVSFAGSLVTAALSLLSVVVVGIYALSPLLTAVSEQPELQFRHTPQPLSHKATTHGQPRSGVVVWLSCCRSCRHQARGVSIFLPASSIIVPHIAAIVLSLRRHSGKGRHRPVWTGVARQSHS